MLAAQISWVNCKSFSYQQAGTIYIVDKEKPSKFMSSKDTHLIPSDLAFRSLVFVEMRSFVCCCPLAITTGSHTFVIFNSSHMQTETRENTS